MSETPENQEGEVSVEEQLQEALAGLAARDALLSVLHPGLDVAKAVEKVAYTADGTAHYVGEPLVQPVEAAGGDDAAGQSEPSAPAPVSRLSPVLGRQTPTSSLPPVGKMTDSELMEHYDDIGKAYDKARLSA